MYELRRAMMRAVMSLRAMSSTSPSASASDSTVISKWKSLLGFEMKPLPRKAPRK